MNIIQKQADDYIMFKMEKHLGYKKFIEKVRSELYEYKKDVYKIEFIERIIQVAKIKFDKHLKNCADLKNCDTNKFYENILFFLQEELEELEVNLSNESFSRNERILLNVTLQKILDDLNSLKVGQELTYNDLSEEFEELKDLYYLNKKNWLQLFQGKITEMVAGGILSETISKEIVKILSENYTDLISG